MESILRGKFPHWNLPGRKLPHGKISLTIPTPMKYPRVRLSHQRERKTKKYIHIYIYVGILKTPVPCKIFPGNFTTQRLSSNRKFSSWKIPQQKISSSRIMSEYIPITSTICKQWENFVTYSPFLRSCGVMSSPKKLLFDLSPVLNKELSQNFDQ